jgi:phage-related protein
MVDTLTLPRDPDQQGWQEEIQPRVSVARFGDGYEQRAVDGMNAILKVVSFSVSNITASERTALDAFLTEKGGWEPFYWTIPIEGSARLWVCGQWSFAGSQANLVSVSLNFREVPA